MTRQPITSSNSLRVAAWTAFVWLALLFLVPAPLLADGRPERPWNVLFIISDDMTVTALSCYGNAICETPNIDRLAAQGTRFTRAFCNATYCGPSRASFLSGYYPHATGVLGYTSPRPAIGDRATWPQHFKNNGYRTARISKVYHMGVPGGIEYGGELIDLYPTVARLCGLEVPDRLQGRDVSRMFDDPTHQVRDTAFCVAPMRRGFLLRDERHAYIQYEEDASKGVELYDLTADPGQYANVACHSEFASIVEAFQGKLAAKLRAVRENDLGRGEEG